MITSKALLRALVGRPGSGPEGDVVIAPSRNGGEDIRQALLDDLVDAVIVPVSGPWSPVMASESDGETFEIIPIR
jgi:hypothetical protein